VDAFERLLRDALRIAERMLLEHGDVMPFGLSESNDGQGQMHVVRGNFQYPSEIVPPLMEQLRLAAGDGSLRALAVITAVYVNAPSGEKVTAVRVDCEDASGNALTWYLPFETKPGDVTFGKPFTARHEARIFVT